MSSARCSSDVVHRARRRRRSSDTRPPSARAMPSAFSARWATTWARRPAGQEGRDAPVVAVEPVDGADHPRRRIGQHAGGERAFVGARGHAVHPTPRRTTGLRTSKTDEVRAWPELHRIGTVGGPCQACAGSGCGRTCVRTHRPTTSPRTAVADQLIIRGAREHNLKDISLDLPRDSLIVFTGLSGSGKSSLAFDTIFAEGQRRYVESLSAYARQFLGQMDKPDVDFIEGLSPGGLDRPEVHVEEPPVHRRHDHRGLRLPPAALRARRPPPLPRLRRADRAADAAADRRPRARARGGSPVPGAGAGDPRPQGGVRRAVPAAPDRRLLAGPGRRRHPHPRRPAEARQAEEAHHRGGRRPAGGQGVVQAPAHRLGRDRAAAGQRAGDPRLRRPAGQGPRPGDEVLRADGLPQRPRPRHRRARAALVLVQQPLRRLPRRATASARGWRSTPTWSSPTPRPPWARARSSRGARPTSPTTSCG